MKKTGKLLKNPILYLVIMLLIMGVFSADIYRTYREFSRDSLSSRGGWNFHFAVDLGESDTWYASEFIRGAREEAEQYGIALEIRGVNSSYQEGGTGFIQWAVNANIDAVLSSGEASGRYEEIVECLERSNTVCVVVQNEISYKKSFYVGTDNYQEGYRLGSLLAERYEGRAVSFALLYPEAETQIVHSRVRGFHEAIRDARNIRILEEKVVESSVLEAMGEAEALLLENQELQGFVCFDEIILDGAARGVIDLNRVKSIDIAGIGYSDEIRNYLEKGIVEFVIATDPFQAGKKAVATAYAQKKEKETTQKTWIDFTVVRKSGDMGG